MAEDKNKDGSIKKTNDAGNLAASPLEFQSIPLDVILGAPLQAVVKAQAASAQSTADFVKAFGSSEIALSYSAGGGGTGGGTGGTGGTGGGGESVRITAPLLSIVPVPNLLIDSLTVNFKYEISQTTVAKESSSKSAKGDAKLGAMLAPWVDASFSGGVSSDSSIDNTVHRGGSLDVTMRASQAPLPAALDKLLQILTNQLRVNGQPVPDSNNNNNK
jgi:hypothetical protein